MNKVFFPGLVRLVRVWVLALAMIAGPATGLSQAATTAPIASLKGAFDAAWARQPEARAMVARREAALARRESAASFFAEPPSALVSAKSDQLTRNRGKREYEAGVAMPLWLPGERARTQALADAEVGAVDSRVPAAQLRVAATVRDAYWAVRRAQVEAEVAQARVSNARQLAGDIARRVKAGDLSRADQHQAEGALASATASLAEAESIVAQTTLQLRALVGAPVDVRDSAAEAVPNSEPREDHPALRELADRSEIARRSRELASIQRRANPELTVGATRERDAFGDAYGQTVTAGVRIPFGSDSRTRARTATAVAEEIEAETQLAIERERILAAIDTAHARLKAMRLQLAATERRATLARESRGFFEKSFALGETDLPTRLRIEFETFEAERQAARIRIEEGSAVSQLQQALGLLPQ